VQETERLLRDKCKAKKFAALWDSLPLPVKRAYEEASQDTAGKKRARQTAIVNAFLTKKPKGKGYDMHPEHPLFAERVSRVQEKELEDKRTGPLAALSRCRWPPHPNLGRPSSTSPPTCPRTSRTCLS
jgi:hypothetical protein